MSYDSKLRYKIKNNLDKPISITIAEDIQKVDAYVLEADGKWNHYVTGSSIPWSKRDGLKRITHLTHTISSNSEITIYERNVAIGISEFEVCIGIKDNVVLENYIENDKFYLAVVSTSLLSGFLLFAFIFNIFFFYIVREKVYLYYGIMLLLGAILSLQDQLFHLFFRENPGFLIPMPLILLGLIISLFLMTFLMFLNVAKNYPKWNKVLLIVNTTLILIIGAVISTFFSILPFRYVGVLDNIATGLVLFLTVSIIVIIIVDLFKKRRFARLLTIAIFPLLLILISLFLWKRPPPLLADFFFITIYWAVIVMSWSLFDRFKFVLNENALQALEKERMAREKEEERNQLIAAQKDELEKQVEDRTAELSRSIIELRQTQTQLIQSEKMASLGELTAGIAHEIQNPLNFVNNFSDVNTELIEELKSQKSKVKNERDEELENEILNDIAENEQKINHHGKRADAIVKGMLQHSRASSGKKELTDINALANEYLRLAYQGLRAKDPSFNVTIQTDFDESIGMIAMVPQDIGRVLLNLYSNAFYAASLPSKGGYNKNNPTVWVKTKKEDNKVVVSVRDNGPGISKNIVAKIFQPFFTTKPTGQGTGLGLSLSYDIIKAHGGELKVETKEGEGSVFIIKLSVA